MKEYIEKLSMRARLRLGLARLGVGDVEIPDNGRPRVFAMLMGDYSNMGDLAITKAQNDFLRWLYPECDVVNVMISRTLPAINLLRASIKPDDVITLTGGGNTGDLYDDMEYLRELIVHSFPNNRIIGFPQMIKFSNSSYGRFAVQRAAKVYNAHPNLTLLSRDQDSLATVLKFFPNVRTALCPDTVLTLKTPTKARERDGIMMVLRNDLELDPTRTSAEELYRAVADLGEVRARDTLFGSARLTMAEAEAALLSMWTEMSAASCVVTDRLHAMVFCVITNTPCVVMDSGNHKVGQTYADWLSGVDGIELCSSSMPHEIRDRTASLIGTSMSHDPEPFRSALAASIRELGSDDADPP